MTEAIGILASVMVLISFLTKQEKTIRLINVLGCILFIIYGIMLGAFSVWFMNGAVLVIHIIRLSKIMKGTKGNNDNNKN